MIQDKVLIDRKTIEKIDTLLAFMGTSAAQELRKDTRKALSQTAESVVTDAYGDLKNPRSSEDPALDIPLPCDVQIGAGTHRAGTKLSTLITRMRALHAMVYAKYLVQHNTLQQRVLPWMMECFGPRVSADTVERNNRFLEEALELVQAGGMTQDWAHKLVDYTFSRPVGEKTQEVGGVMITLAAWCLANQVDMHDAGEIELVRIMEPKVMDKIRRKQKSKPQFSPLPGVA